MKSEFRVALADQAGTIKSDLTVYVGTEKEIEKDDPNYEFYDCYVVKEEVGRLGFDRIGAEIGSEMVKDIFREMKWEWPR